MTNTKEDVLAVKQILQECCDQCCQGAFCISYFKRLKGAISKHNQKNINVVFDSIIKENIINILQKLQDTSWLIYELEGKFPSESTVIELSKILTITIIENASQNKEKIEFHNIVATIPQWLSINDQDLILGSIIQFLFYLDNYVECDN